MKAKTIYFKLLIACMLLALVGCQSTIYQDAAHNVDQVQSQIAAANRQHSAFPQADGKLGLYSRAAKYVNGQKPRWLKQHVELHGRDLPFSFYTDRLLKHTPAFVSFAPDVRRDRSLSLSYSGNIEGALKALAARTGYAYTLDENTVTWSAFVTRTFDISFMPGDSSYLLGQNNNMHYRDAANQVGNHDNMQYSTLAGHLSVWNDLRKTLQQLRSKEGKVSVSQATTTVTVYDRPSRVHTIAHYLQVLNDTLSREVALEVQVLEVKLNRGYNYGVNWKLVRDAVDGLRMGAEGAVGSPVTLTALGANTAQSAAGFILKAKPNSAWAGTDMLVNALSQQGKVSTVTRPRVVTLNNQVAEIDINEQRGYLRQVSVTTAGNPSATTTALTPGTIKTGFTLFILPKIYKRNVFLQLSSTISNLLNISTVTSSTGTDSSNSSQIQLPTVTEKRFNQRSLVPSGATLVLAGFKQLKNEANHTAMFHLTALGGRGVQQDNTETIVLITPTIIKG